MTDVAQNEMIAIQVLRNSHHFNKALAIYDAYDEIRRRVIKAFVSDLEEAVAGALRTTGQRWAVEAFVDSRPGNDWLWKRDCRLTVRQGDWPDGHFVGVGADKYGPTDLWFGVWGITGENVASSVKPHFDQHVIEGGWGPALNPPRQWCYGFGNLFERRWGLGDWKSTEAIGAMHQGREGDYHQRIRDMLVRIAQATDELLRPQVNAAPP